MFELDRYGFPTIHVPLADTDVHVHFLPVTRSQFEFYLADHPSPGMDMEWYDARLKDHPRVDPGSVDEKNYAGLFTTGLRPFEAQQVADLFGDAGGVGLPDVDTWQAIFRYAVVSPPVDLGPLHANPKLSPFARRILDRLAMKLDAILKGAAPTLADQMFLRHGVNEIVERTRGGSAYSVIGYPASRFSTLTASDPRDPKPSNPSFHQPNASHGFRLVWRTA